MRKSCRGHNILSQESSGPSVGVYSKLVRGYHQQMGIYNTLNGCMTGVLQESFDSEVKKANFLQTVNWPNAHQEKACVWGYEKP